jgi:hypothetical protein
LALGQGQTGRKLDSGYNSADCRAGEDQKRLRAYLASDKSLYLDMLMAIVGVLLFMCIAGVILIFGGLKLIEFPLAELMALGAIAIAIMVGVAAMQFGSLDNSKLAEPIRKINAEIMRLEEARRKLQKPSV